MTIKTVSATRRATTSNASSVKGASFQQEVEADFATIEEMQIFDLDRALYLIDQADGHQQLMAKMEICRLFPDLGDESCVARDREAGREWLRLATIDKVRGSLATLFAELGPVGLFGGFAIAGCIHLDGWGSILSAIALSLIMLGGVFVTLMEGWHVWDALSEWADKK